MPGAGSRNIGGRALAAGLALALALAASAAAAEPVDPARYRQFWLWGGVVPNAALRNAATIYVLQGRVAAAHGHPVLARQGAAPAALGAAEAYLVFRLETLAWDEGLVAGFSNIAAAWEHAGARVAGIQLDFDARTPHLDDYARFLGQVRQDLPERYRLSITGLLDWSTGGAPAAFEAMAGTVDEIVFQAYRGRQTIAHVDAYLGAVARTRLPFKIGLVEGGAWEPNAEARLAASPYFRGAVVFLTPRR
jgi:hypothetical protein